MYIRMRVLPQEQDVAPGGMPLISRSSPGEDAALLGLTLSTALSATPELSRNPLARMQPCWAQMVRISYLEPSTRS